MSSMLLLPPPLEFIESLLRESNHDQFHHIFISDFQDDLHVVDSLELPTDNPTYLSDLVEERGWGPSVLFIDE